MIISTFKSVQKAYVDLRLDLSWDELSELLIHHYDVDSKESVELYNMVDFKTTDYELGRKYHYSNGERTETYDEIPNTIRRCKNNMVSITGIVLDVDKHQTIEQTIEKLDGLEYVLYTTFRHTIDNHRFRVVIPFSRPLLAEDVVSKQQDIKDTFPGVDNASFSVSQSFYFHSGKNDPISFRNRGIMIDPYQFKTEVIKPYENNIEYNKNTSEEITHLITELKRLYPTLDYETWIRVTWAFCHELGQSEGINLMRQYYPEGKQGEYKKLSTTRYNGKKVTIATIVKMIKDKQGLIKRSGYGLYSNKKILKREEYGTTNQ